jgi:acetolactate synthase I/III small subunit
MIQDDQTVMKHVIAALVSNEPGVLAHIAGMFAARGFNIDSLVVGRTENPELSRMTIVVNGTMKTLDQVRKQLAKVVEVVKVVDYLGTDHVERDLMLVRVASPAGQRSEILELAAMFRAKIVDVGREELMIELSGPEEKLEAFIDLIQPYGIVELAPVSSPCRAPRKSAARRPPAARSPSAAAAPTGATSPPAAWTPRICRRDEPIRVLTTEAQRHRAEVLK